MATAKLSSFLRQLTRGMAAEALGDLSDRELVKQVLSGNAEPAFEMIVRRHGPMVYRVAWRVLRDDTDVEDAFQATFLLLAQKLRTLRNQASLASWLHGVAHRVALRARAHAAARRRHEERTARLPGVPPGESPWDAPSEAMPSLVDDELARLPDQWRLPLVLCYLEGRTQDEAAAQLGWSKSTLRRRLDDARAALGRRLRRRDVLPAALAAVLTADCMAAAPLPAPLIGAVVSGGARVSAGQGITAIASARVAALTEGVAMTVSLTRKIAATLVMVAGLLIGGAGLSAMGQAPAADENQPPQLAKIIPEKLELRPARLSSGTWLLALPAGFKYTVVVRPLGGERYALDKAVRFSGVYELRDDRLVMAEPLSPVDAAFAWRLDGPDQFTLVEQPPVDKTGANYLGATLRRLVGAGGEWGTEVRGVRGLVEPRDEQTRFIVGEPVWLVCRTRNFGAERPRVHHGERHHFQLKVTRSDGTPVPQTAQGLRELQGATNETAAKVLPPSAEVSETYRLDRLFDLSRPGHYRVTFIHEVDFGEQRTVAIEANVLMMAILKAPEARVAAPLKAAPVIPRVPAAPPRKADATLLPPDTAAAGRTLERIKAAYRLIREPAYQAPVQYCLVLLGGPEPTPIWLASDGVTMYVDRNGNGDLTDVGEAVPFRKEAFAAFFADSFPAGAAGTRHTHLHFAVRQRDWENNKGGYWAIRADVGGRYPMYAFAHKFAKNPNDAPVVHLGGPLHMQLEQVEGGRLVRGQEIELSANVVGQYTGTEKAFIDVDHRCPKDIDPVAEIVFPPSGPGAKAMTLRVPLTQRC